MTGLETESEWPFKRLNHLNQNEPAPRKEDRLNISPPTRREPMRPYYTPPEPKKENTPWQGPDTAANSIAFEQAFVIETVCAWCKRHLRGPVGGPVKSHGICQDCKAEQISALEQALGAVDGCESCEWVSSL